MFWRMKRSGKAQFLIMAVFAVAACGDDSPKTPDGPPAPQCSDGADNDADGQTDFPADPGCSSADDDSEDSPTGPSCNDGRDNDGDGKIDYPDDPGCAAPNQEGEEDDCPSGPNCPECGNGIDDDGENGTDYPADPGCMSASDNDELTFDPVACGVGTMIMPLPMSGMASGTFSAMASSSTIVSTCAEASGAPAVAYEFTIDVPTFFQATTNDVGTAADTVLVLRSEDCDAAASEIACSDDVDTETYSTVVEELQPGTYYLIVKGKTATETGAYTVVVTRTFGEGVPCTMQSECGMGLVCRTPVGGSAMVCADPVCSDGLDDDSDGKIDFPNDPGCTSAIDDTEADDCPSGPNCPACSDGIDNDGDTLTDYPMDTSCPSASGNSESCSGEQDPIDNITMGTTMTTMVGMNDDRMYEAACAGSPQAGGLDRFFTVTVPATTSITFDTVTSPALDTILTVLPTTCAEPRLGCDDDGGPGVDSAVTLTNLPAGSYVLYVDLWRASTTPTAFNINVSGTLPSGASCTAATTLGGAITCPSGETCGGTAGAETCRPAACNDAIDADGDGFNGFPTDPGCTDPNDNDEADDCPTGPNCPVCSNDLDDDGDTFFDYPADPSCASASGDSESCSMESDPITTITSGTTMSTMVGMTNDRTFAPACSGGSGGLDRLFIVTVPATTAIRFDTVTSPALDTVLTVLPATCAEPRLGCDDDAGPGLDSVVNLTNLAAGTYVLQVDLYGSFTTPAAFNVNVSGTLPVGASCEPANTLGGAITCPVANPCSGPAGAQICQPAACGDAIDADGDGFTGFPDDPGCTSTADTDETDDCPSGPNCPQCSNDLDDDGMGGIDYPADVDCTSAADTTENTLYCSETDPMGSIVGPVTMGTSVGLTNDAQYDTAVCGASGTGGVDQVFTITIPALDALVFDTETSALDTVIALFTTADCTNEVQGECDDDGGVGAGDSLLTLGPITAGTYVLRVEGYSSFSTGAFVINTRGTLPTGASCEPANTLGGAFTCAAAHPCMGTAGSQTCQ